MGRKLGQRERRGAFYVKETHDEGAAILRGPRRAHSLRDRFSLAGPSVGSRAANTPANRFVMPAAKRSCTRAPDSQSATRWWACV